MRLIIAVLISLALVSLAWAASVTGPTGNTDLYIPQWDGDNTQRLKNGVMLDTNTSLAGNSDYRIPSQKAVKAYIATQLAAGTIMVYPSSGIPRSTGSAWTTPATYSDIVALWTTCSGYLKSDGTCDTPSGTVDVSGTPTNHQWAGWTDADTIKGFTITASKPVCSDASGDPAVCAGTEGVWAQASHSHTYAEAGAYDADTWNTNTNAPTKDAVRDKIEAMPAYTEPGANGPLCRTGEGEVGACTSVKDVAPFFSFVIAAPAITDDINIFKAPYAITITAISCIVQGTTSVTGQLQECDANGANCADLDSDIVCDADGQADDGTLTDNAIAANAWVRWKTTSVTDTPTFLTVTVKYTP